MSWWKRNTLSDDMPQMALAHIATRLFNTPLMILPGKLEIIERAIGPRFGILIAEPQAALTDEQRRRRPYSINNGTGIINVFGSLVQRSGGAGADSGLTSYQQLSREFAMAMEDDEVERVLLLVDSPGGEAAGVWDLVDQIAAGHQRKAVVSLADGMAASAAYAIASAAGEMYATQGSVVGSIGVIASHVDRSKFDENLGVKVDHIIYGEQKADFSPHAPLSERARAEIQKLVNDAGDLFVSKVSIARGLSPDAIRATEARLFTTSEALSLKLIDGQRTLATLLQSTTREVFVMSTQTTQLQPAAQASPAELTLEAIKTARPDLVVALGTEATGAERRRIQEILTLAGIQLPDLVQQACFTQPVALGDAAIAFQRAKLTVQKTNAAAFLNDATPPVQQQPAETGGAENGLQQAHQVGQFVNSLRAKRLHAAS